MNEKYDFSGWATKNNLKCSDGRTIRHNAFKDNDGKTVPLVWNHNHATPEEVLGHALLENRDEGVYCYGKFNDTSSGQIAKVLVQHGDITALSIYAGGLKQIASDVIHGDIKEVSLVHAGANPEAFIDTVIAHSEDSDEEAVIYMGDNLFLSHADNDSGEKSEEGDSSETIADVFNTLTEKQKKVVYAMVGQALSENKNNNEEENNEMKYNVFEKDDTPEKNTLSHSAMETIIGDIKRFGSVKESFMAHADEYGIENVEYLFPDDRMTEHTPQFISRNMDWVQKVMNGVHHTPFSRIKSMFADITEDQARAKGYIKGTLKKEEVFSLLKRSTSPTTVYKKQKMDRDDVTDIVDIDVIAWIKTEMRMLLDEELARAYMIGDGRLSSDDDKIDESRIRPIANDNDLFVIRWAVSGSDSAEKAKNFIHAAVKSRKNYKGSGSPSLYTTEDMLTDMLLLEDTTGRKLYKTEAELATALRVKEIVTIAPMDNYTDKDNKSVYGIIVNLSDYTVGADKGGAVNMFDDFDIDYNQQKYLIETRCSGALTKPFSAIVLRSGTATQSEEPTLANAKVSINN